MQNTMIRRNNFTKIYLDVIFLSSFKFGFVKVTRRRSF